jgi:hypothetical protein
VCPFNRRAALRVSIVEFDRHPSMYIWFCIYIYIYIYRQCINIVATSECHGPRETHCQKSIGTHSSNQTHPYDPGRSEKRMGFRVRI